LNKKPLRARGFSGTRKARKLTVRAISFVFLGRKPLARSKGVFVKIGKTGKKYFWV
jgi:hypothetical protein